MSKTKIYDTNEIQTQMIAEIIKDVKESLEEKGYDSINQIVGYLMSGDPGYISSYKEARKKIIKYDRAKIIEVLVRDFIS